MVAGCVYRAQSGVSRTLDEPLVLLLIQLLKNHVKSCFSDKVGCRSVATWSAIFWSSSAWSHHTTTRHVFHGVLPNAPDLVRRRVHVERVYAEHAFPSRYASPEMVHLFSPSMRSSTWRSLWLNLAIAEKELGLPISDKAIEQMKANLKLDEEQMKIAAEEEKKRRRASGGHGMGGCRADKGGMHRRRDGACAHLWCGVPRGSPHHPVGRMERSCAGTKRPDPAWTVWARRLAMSPSKS